MGLAVVCGWPVTEPGGGGVIGGRGEKGGGEKGGGDVWVDDQNEKKKGVTWSEYDPFGKSTEQRWK